MKKRILFTFCSLFYIGLLSVVAQNDPNWSYIRKENTGIGGILHYVVQGDAFNNIWTGGYESSDEGSLVRISTNDTIYTNWATYSENYLPNGLIFDIEFDSTGIIWVGTESGITTSEDGINWQHFDTSNSNLLANNTEAIAIDLNDGVWTVNTDGSTTLSGIGYFDGNDWSYYTSTNSGLPPAALRDIAVDADGIKWIGSDNGLISYDGTSWQQLTTANSGISSNDIKEVSVDGQNRILALVGNAVDIFDGTNWTQINDNDWPISNFQGRYIHTNNDRIILTESSNSRILMFDGTDWTTESVNFTIYDCFIDNMNNYWVSGYGVVAKFNGTDWTRYTSNNTGLPENFNEDIFIDSKGRRWFANGSGGIQVFDCPNWEVYGPNNEGLFPNPQTGFSTTIGTYITEDSDGDIWFSYDGTSGYVIRVPNGDYHDYAAWVTYDTSNSTPFLQFPEELEATNNGELFVRTDNNLIMYDKITDVWTVWNLSNGLTAPPLSLAGRAGGSMYVGHYQGIDIYNNGTWTNMDLSPQGIEHVHDIGFDNNDHMWLGTTTGLWKFDGTDWINWNESNSNIAANNVTAIDFDTNNNVYISAHNTQIFPYYGGISFFDGTGNTFTTFLDGSSPLAHKQVEDIAVDSFGNVWALTQSEGFSIYNPNGISGFECIDRSLQRTNLGIPEIGLNPIFKGYSYPNPFSSETTIVYNLKIASSVSVSIYNILGKKVNSFEIAEAIEGKNEFKLSLASQPSGIYFCTLVSNKQSTTLKLVKN